MENEAENSLRMIVEEESRPNPPQLSQREPGVNREHYFAVTFNQDGQIIRSDFAHIFSVSESEGKIIATNIYQGQKYQDRNYRYTVNTKENETLVAVIDVKERVDSFNRFLLSSTIVSLISYSLLAGLIVLVSKFVFKTSEQSYQKQKEFITNASHELKTPLTIISTDLDIVEMNYGKDEWTESIRDQVKRLTVMTNQLVTLSKLDEKDLNRFPFMEFDLSKISKECVETFTEVFESKNLLFKHEIEEEVKMDGNEYLVNELLYILLDNASKYTTEGGEVALNINKNKNKINIKVSNSIEDNANINPNLLFERFYRSPNSSHKEGSGIGLSIAKEIVDLHKGKISAEIIEKKIIFHVEF